MDERQPDRQTSDELTGLSESVALLTAGLIALAMLGGLALAMIASNTTPRPAAAPAADPAPACCCAPDLAERVDAAAAAAALAIGRVDTGEDLLLKARDRLAGKFAELDTALARVDARLAELEAARPAPAPKPKPKPPACPPRKPK